MQSRRGTQIEAEIEAEIEMGVATTVGQQGMRRDTVAAPPRKTGDRRTQEQVTRGSAGEGAAMPEGTNELANSSGVHGMSRVAPPTSPTGTARRPRAATPTRSRATAGMLASPPPTAQLPTARPRPTPP